MKGIRSINFIYLLPYLALLVLGIWYRSQITPIAFLNGDSGNYLFPAYIKALANEWHKGERPMPYLQFIYLTLSKQDGLKYTVIAQQALSLLGGLCLTCAWLLFVAERRKYVFLWHLMGYLMLAIFVQSPTLMYYEQLIGPESPSMFVMCVLILCLAGIYSTRLGNNTRGIFLSAAIFINLYLIYPMPKWLFAGAFLELLFIVKAWRFETLSNARKRMMLLVPHFFFLLLVYIPEHVNKIDNPNEDRTYLEYEQMAYTHFDLLVRDPTDFPVTKSLQDSLVAFYHESQQFEPRFLIGFSSDRLMWGQASRQVTAYYKNNYDSIGHFYKTLSYTLVKKYPFALSLSILKQLGIFYFPTHFAHKNLCSYPNTKILYDGTKALLPDWDALLAMKLKPFGPTNPELPEYFLDPKYPEKMEDAKVCINEELPFLFKNTFWFFRWFDHIFLFVMCSFFATAIFAGRGRRWLLVSLLYLCIFIYATTIAIVHTFDIDRFLCTILPFFLVVTFMAMAEVGEQWLDWTLPFITNRFKK